MLERLPEAETSFQPLAGSLADGLAFSSYIVGAVVAVPTTSRADDFLACNRNRGIQFYVYSALLPSTPVTAPVGSLAHDLLGPFRRSQLA